MANIKMKTLTVGEDVFEIVDEQAREDIKELQENGVKTSVESVNGKTGVVTLDASDVGALSASDIVDELTSTESNKALSARLGFQLNSKLTTLRNEFNNLEGDGTIEVDMEEGTFSHKDSGVAANWYGEQGGGDLNFGGSFTVPGALNIDAKGHITEAKDNQFTLPDNEATEAKKGLLSPADKAKLNKLKPPFNFELNNDSASNIDVNITLFDADEEAVAEFDVVGTGRAKVSRNSTSGALEINVEKETVDLSGYATTQQLATVEGKIPTVAQDIGDSTTDTMSQEVISRKLYEIRNTDIEQTERIESLSEEIADKLGADQLNNAVNDALATAKSSGEFDGQRGTGILKVTTAPTSYTTAIDSYTPKYRMSLSTIKSQSGVSEVLIGDVIQYSYYQYQIDYLTDSYAYTSKTRVSLRGGTGAAGTTPHIGDNGNWFLGETDTGVKAEGGTGTFFVTVTPTSETTGVADKTQAEMEEAFNAGKTIYCNINYGGNPFILPLMVDPTQLGEIPSFNFGGTAGYQSIIVAVYNGNASIVFEELARMSDVPTVEEIIAQLESAEGASF